MKLSHAMVASAWAFICAVVLFGCAGCAALKGETPPTKFETVVFNVQTNRITNVVSVPVEVWSTNTVTKYRTNTVGVTVTNLVQTFSVTYATNTVTNVVKTYDFTPKDGVQQDIESIGTTVGTFIPGADVVAGILATALIMWGRLRSSKKAGNVLAQNIQAIREFLKTLPDGAKYDEALVQWMRKNQKETGAVKEVVSILAKYVDKTEAKTGAQEIKAAIDALS